MKMDYLKKGDFVKVGEDVGVVVFLENENNTPNEHLGVWYGEVNEEAMPKYRTVPTEYCQLIEYSEVYH